MEVIPTDRNEEAFLSLSETARLFNVSERTIHRWIHEGRIPVYKPGHAYRFRMSDLEEFLATREVRPKAPAPPPEPQEDQEERRAKPRLVSGSAHLRGTGKLEAAGVVREIMRAVDEYTQGAISREECQERVDEIVTSVAA